MILDEIIKDKGRRLIEHKQRIPAEAMRKAALELPASRDFPFYKALGRKGLSIIGEFKNASPSMGIMDNKISLSDRIDQYNRCVDAISCLTEEDHFNGSVDYLKQIRRMTELPIIRKDFIIDSYQIYEAHVIGADAVLLIAAVLTDPEMEELYGLAHELGLDVLLEVHDERELMRAVRLGADIVGVNNRNLKDFTIDLSATERLSNLLSGLCSEKRPLLVSESGVVHTEHIRYLNKCNVDALLIGRAFMETESPEALAKEWKAVCHEV